MDTRNREVGDKFCADRYRKEQKQMTLSPIKLENKAWINKYQEGWTVWICVVKYLSGQDLVISRWEKREIYFKRKEDTSSLIIGRISLVEETWLWYSYGW